MAKKVKIDKYKVQIGNIIGKGLKEQVEKNIRKLTQKERTLINKCGNDIMNNKNNGIQTWTDSQLLQLHNTDIKDTYIELEKNKDIPNYNYELRIQTLQNLEKQVKDELIKRNLL